jgi:RNA polymerase sigma factor (sigma-70 family)
MISSCRPGGGAPDPQRAAAGAGGDEEPEFWRAFREGDPRALAEVYRAHVTTVARRLRSHPLARRAAGEEVGDLVQETFCRAYAESARRRYDSARPYRPYLLRISLNLLTDRARSWRLEVAACRDLAADPSASVTAVEAPQAGDPLALAGVRDYVAGLRSTHKRVFEARYVQGLSQRRAARALGISHQSLRTVEKQIKEGLRLHLEVRTGSLERSGAVVG